MSERINMILNPLDIYSASQFIDPLFILRAGFYPHEREHCIFRGFNGADALPNIPYAHKNVTQDTILNEMIIIYCIAGEGYLATPNTQYNVKVGDLIFCDKDVLHSYGSNPSNPWTIYWFHFTGDFATYFAHSLNTAEGCTVLSLGYISQYIHTMHRICELLKNPANLLARSTANSYLKMLLSEILLARITYQNITSTMHQTINDLISYMHQHLHNNLNLQQLSDYANLSKYYLSHQFKKTTGFSPIHYFTQLKIQKACDLLVKSNESIQTISLQLGFSNSYYFSNTFKEHTGFSPSQYRRMIHKTY